MIPLIKLVGVYTKTIPEQRLNDIVLITALGCKSTTNENTFPMQPTA
jgi:hypothetical protein